MATKPATLYSTNSKMDGSGITAKQPRSEYAPTKMVNQGTSPKSAMDILEEKVEAKDNYNTCSYWDK